MSYEKIKQTILKKDDPFTDILGQEEVKKELKSALLVGRNIIIIGQPGIGKQKTSEAGIRGTADADVADSVGTQSYPLDAELADKGNGTLSEISYIGRVIFNSLFFR